MFVLTTKTLSVSAVPVRCSHVKYSQVTCKFRYITALRTDITSALGLAARLAIPPPRMTF